MRPWHKSPTLLKYLVGQHIANGASVAASVAMVTFVASMALGFGAGQPATLGAIGASIADFPSPWPVKAQTILTGFGLSIISTIAIELVDGTGVGEVLVIGLLAFAAGLITGYGRWALSLNAQILVPMVFMMGLPPLSAAGLARAEVLYILGGLGYFAIAMALTFLTSASDRRLMASESLREFAAYLRALAGFTDPSAELAEVYGAGIRQQAALSEQLQAARALLLYHPRRTKERVRLAATIGVELDAFDALVAAISDFPRLRAAENAGPLLQRLGVLLRAGALDLQRLSLDLLAHEAPKLPPDHSVAYNAAIREAQRLMAAPETTDAECVAITATMRRFDEARGHIRRLERILADDVEAEAAIGDVDLNAFWPRRSFALAQLKPHLSPASPAFRYAARLALAMMAGGVVALSLGYEGHGNWVLLTIAVILRPGYGLTRQRRDQRLIGTLIGCVLASGAVGYLPVGALIALQATAIALTHAFVRLNYWLASIGASMTALISLHLVYPTASAPALTKFVATLIGAAIAHLFNHVWPSWEHSVAPDLVRRLLQRASAFANIALGESAVDQDYRLVRRALIEAVAALSDSAARMGGEPVAARRGLEEMTAMLIAASMFAAQVSAARLDLKEANGPDAPQVKRRIEAARKRIVARLAAASGKGSAAAAKSPAPLDRLSEAVDRLVAAADTYEQAARAS